MWMLDDDDDDDDAFRKPEAGEKNPRNSDCLMPRRRRPKLVTRNSFFTSSPEHKSFGEREAIVQWS
jgi:hypothetical protein